MTATAAQVTVAINTIDMVTVGWSTGRQTADAVREYVFTASHETRTRLWALMDGQWHPLCPRCGGSGNVGYGPENGVCYLCLGYGVHGDYFADGEGLEAEIARQNRLTGAASVKRQREIAKREAEIAAWREANADLVTWALAVPSTGKELIDRYSEFGSTPEEATARVRHDLDRVESVEQMDDGSYRALIAIEEDTFAGYSTAVQDALRMVRRGSDLEGRSTGLLRKVMADEADAPAEAQNSRHAGAEGERLTITGEVTMARWSDMGYWQIKVAGQGADAGITFFTNTSSRSADDLSVGDLVQVKATIKRNEVYRGVKSDRVGRAVFTPADAIPTPAPAPAPEPVATPAPVAPVEAPSAPQAAPKATRKGGRREALGASCVDGWELLYDKPRAGAEVVRQGGRYALACKTHKTLHLLDRLTDEGKVRKAGGWCTECH